MSGLAVQIGITGKARGLPARLAKAIAPERIAPVIGQDLTRLVTDHLVAYGKAHPNRLGGTRTQYYGKAADKTSYTVQGDTVTISVNQVGIRLHYYGGTVSKKKKKYLTIPVHPLAHGKRAGDHFSGKLKLVFGKNRQPVALALPSEAKGQKDTILYALKKSVTIRADKKIIPGKTALRQGLIPFSYAKAWTAESDWNLVPNAFRYTSFEAEVCGISTPYYDVHSASESYVNNLGNYPQRSKVATVGMLASQGLPTNGTTADYYESESRRKNNTNGFGFVSNSVYPESSTLSLLSSGYYPELTSKLVVGKERREVDFGGEDANGDRRATTPIILEATQDDTCVLVDYAGVLVGEGEGG
jgi:hypothetical protein